jgi:hypothetical protein
VKDVIVIDQAVPSSIQDMLETLALSNKVNWFRSERATVDEGPRLIFPTTPDALEVQQFTHTLYELNKPSSQLFHAVLPVLTAIPYTIKQLIRVKFNLCVYAQTDNPNAHGVPHVDFTEVADQLISAVYCVNDSTGDTIIFDQRYGQSGPLTVRTRVAPRKGRLVVFDGSLLHAGNTPRTNAPRVNININAYIYEGGQTAAEPQAA